MDKGKKPFYEYLRENPPNIHLRLDSLTSRSFRQLSPFYRSLFDREH